MFVAVIDGCLDEVVTYADVIGYFSSKEKAVEYLISEGFALDGINGSTYEKTSDLLYEEAVIKELKLIK